MPAEKLLDIVWVLVATAMVLFMQAGFAALESGSTRSKNTINVAIKNLVDLCVTGLCYWFIGFGMMFGLSQSGLIGSDHFLFSDLTDPSKVTFFLFQFVFCGTAATIVSGAIAERMTFPAYIVTSIVVSLLIYPIFGHWAWGGANQGIAAGLLNSKGFVDFAGSTVVHSVGGWTALAAVIVIGARIGRFGPDGKPNRINPSSIPLMVTGAFILWFGWIGFNGGSTLAMNAQVPGIVLNTLLAACAGGCFGLFFSWWRNKIAVCEPLINGVLAGLVAITAGCHAVTPISAIVIGIIGSGVMMTIEHLMIKAKLDDAVGAVPVHLGAGIWGTLAVGFFGDLSILNTGLGRGEQILMQFAGVAAAGVWAFPLAFVALKLIQRFMPLRVTAEQEYDGLNVAEHGATTEIMDFFKVLDKQEVTGDLSLRAPVEPFTEVGQIAKKYNRVLDRVEDESKSLQKAKNDIAGILQSVSEGLIVVRSDLKLSKESSRAAHLMLNSEKLEGERFEDVLFPYGEKNPGREAKGQISSLVATAFALFIPDQFVDMAANCIKQIRFPLTPDCKEFKTYRLSYAAVIENDQINKVIIVISDETELMNLRSMASASYRQLAQGLRQIATQMSGEGLHTFLDETTPLAETAAKAIAKMELDDVATLFRQVHTIKGGARLFKLDFIQHLAHSIEEKLDYLRQNPDHKLNDEESQNLVTDMQAVRESLEALRSLAEPSTKTVDVKADWESFIKTFVAGTETLAKELTRNVAVHIEDRCLLAGRDRTVFSTCLVHLLRNAIDHGIESEADRMDAGKSPQASLSIEVAMRGRRIEAKIVDDGRGIDVKKIFAKARDAGFAGIENAKAEDLDFICDIICRPGFTSRSEVTDVSGRGVGMDAVRAELDMVGGALKLESTSPTGTCFSFSWTAQDERSESHDKDVNAERSRAVA